MLELLQAAISGPNIVFTVLLGLILLYWLSVILGALDMDSFDVDLDMDLDVDVDVDMDVDIDADVDVDADVDTDTEVSGNGGGFMIGILRFFNFGKIPFMILMSLIILSMWSISVLINHEGSYLNPTNTGLIALIWVVPNLIGSLLITKILTQPLVPVFEKLDTSAQQEDYTGKMGILTIPASKDSEGQVKLTINHAVVILRARAMDDTPLKRNDDVLIVDKVEGDEQCFWVKKMDAKHS